jgi:hypothetical protein
MKKIFITFLLISCSNEKVKQKSFDFNIKKTGNLGICACNQEMKLDIQGKKNKY